MQLDADLGIDSIKRVEILSASRSGSPTRRSIKPEHLGTLRTLRPDRRVPRAGRRPGPAVAPPAERPGRRDAGRRRRADPHEPRVVLRRLDPGARAAGRSPSAARPCGSAAGARSGSSTTASALAAAAAIRAGARAGIRPRVIAGDEVAASPRRTRPRRPDRPGAGRDGSDAAFIADAFRLLRAAGPALRAVGARGGAALADRLAAGGRVRRRGALARDRPDLGRAGRAGQDGRARVARGRLQGDRPRPGVRRSAERAAAGDRRRAAPRGPGRGRPRPRRPRDAGRRPGARSPASCEAGRRRSGRATWS